MITTCNQLAHLVPECDERLKLFWPEVERIVLHFDEKPDVECETHYLGPQAKFGRSWTDPLIPFFDQFDEHHFVLWLDDYMLQEPPDYERLAEIEGWVRDGVAKADLSQDRAKFGYEEFHNGLIKSRQDSKWRSSLQAAIWNTDYFRQYLEPGMSAWDFETFQQYAMMGDGRTIIGTLEGVCRYTNASQCER